MKGSFLPLVALSLLAVACNDKNTSRPAPTSSVSTPLPFFEKDVAQEDFSQEEVSLIDEETQPLVHEEMIKFEEAKTFSQEVCEIQKPILDKILEETGADGCESIAKSDLEEIDELDLSYSDIQNVTESDLKYLPNLRSVELYGNPIYDLRIFEARNIEVDTIDNGEMFWESLDASPVIQGIKSAYNYFTSDEPEIDDSKSDVVQQD
ncbi:MAG: hypothetical protein H6622_00060 [Halobacteriovoraceae bacterium]|nr:hypothetical protein [Halobacteriovoraceae bacterium]